MRKILLIGLAPMIIAFAMAEQTESLSAPVATGTANDLSSIFPGIVNGLENDVRITNEKFIAELPHQKMEPGKTDNVSPTIRKAEESLRTEAQQDIDFKVDQWWRPDPNFKPIM